ncbi:MAG: DUF2207 domain-containing protein [bacterium]|nr:DUF2207 domain-containing protein [bacterium]
MVKNARSNFFYLLLPVAALLLLVPFCARAEKISNFNVEITVNSDASILVREAIIYDFENASRHGIYRDIPVKYKARGGNYNLRLDNVSVTDESGLPYAFTVSGAGSDERVKIGDADRLVTGVKTYVLSYRVRRALNYFSDHDELYWNATGNGWSVPIDKASATVFLPISVPADKAQAGCFAGSLGSQEACAAKDFDLDSVKNVRSVVFSQGALGANQGLTVVVGFPKGLVSAPTAWQNFLDILRDNWVLALPLLVFCLMYYLWHTRGRDPAGRGVVVAQYESPDNLTAAEVGTIVDNKAQNRDVSAAIVELAVKGYIKIKKDKRQGLLLESDDWQLQRLKMEDDSLNYFEKELMKRLFSFDEALVVDAAVAAPLPVERTISLYSLKDKFFQDLQEVKKQIYQSVVLKGYYSKNPDMVIKAYVGAGGVIIFASFWAAALFGVYVMLATMASGLIVILFGLIMPARTKKGADVRDDILGLQEYLSVAEKERIKFHNAPEKTPERFEKLLPLAMVLGVENQWAKQFEGIYNQSPAWYQDASGARFNSLLFVGSLNHFTGAANANLASVPHQSAGGGGSGFGGGGFSGGGFGGGGGGSW